MYGNVKCTMLIIHFMYHYRLCTPGGALVKNEMVRIALFTLKAILALGVILNVFLSCIGVLKKS